MGKFLLLSHLQNAPCADISVDTSDEDLPIKNTFIHFDVPRECKNHREAAMPRFRTAPSPEGCKIQRRWCDEPSDTKLVDEDTSPTIAADDTSTLASDDASTLAPEVPPCVWPVCGRRLKGRDTRISTTLRPVVAGGPATAEVVVSIFPVPVSSKRGGSCFKAANGMGRIQLKCNNPMDVELSVCISVGGMPTRTQLHNFANNPLMIFNTDWDFKASIDPDIERPTVSVALQLLGAEDHVNMTSTLLSEITSFRTPMKNDPAAIDPAIVAVGPLKGLVESLAKVPSLPEAGKPKPHTCDFGDFTPSSTPSVATPEVTPRSSVPQPSPQPSPQVPSSPPFFTLGDSQLFSVTLRRADGYELGLDVLPDEMTQELVVQHVISGGAAEAWNRQCFAGPFSAKAIVPTDRIVGINGRCDCHGMLEECRERQLLKIFVVRGDLPHTEIPAGWCGVSTTIQYVAVPVFFPVPCVKHDIVDCHGGHVATSPDHFGCCQGEAVLQALAPGVLRAAAPEFVPPETGRQEGIEENSE